MNSYRLAAALVLLGAAGLSADERAGSITILPPPPTMMDWHAGNRHWNLQGAQHFHLPMPSEHEHGGFGHHGFGHSGFGGIGPSYFGSYYVVPGYWSPGYYGYSSSYYYNYNYGYPYYPANGLPYFPSPGLSLPDMNAVLQAQRDADARTREREVRSSHPEAQARARRFEQQGDRQFREKNYARAYELYRSARRAAPELAEVHFRIAQALTALGRFTSAVTAIQRGLRLDPTWPESEFDLNDLYGDDPLPLLSHQERLAIALADDMDNPDLLFLLGWQLFFTGQRAKARPFFERAAQLTGDSGHILPFLRVPLPDVPEPDPRRQNAGDVEQAPAPPDDAKIPRNATRREI